MFVKIYIEFIMQIDALIKELKSTFPKKESLEWYLLNNLTKYSESVSKANTKEDIKRATKIFSRFCVETMD